MKKTHIYLFVLTILNICALSGCSEKNPSDTSLEIAVTNSYLQCAVQDIYGIQKDVFCLAPPGMCPGHFDISPSQVNKLSNCRILLLFDFQEKVESSLAGLKNNGLKTFLVQTKPGLCIPETYLETCHEVCKILSSEFPDQKIQFEQRLTEISERLEKLGDNLHTKITDAKLASVKVVSSSHQSDFANWLGLQAISTFAGSDSETAFNINDCINQAKEQDVKFIIANKQEGTYLADSLADRLNVPVIVFGNFPESTESSNGFDELLNSNVNAIVKANQ